MICVVAGYIVRRYSTPAACPGQLLAESSPILRSQAAVFHLRSAIVPALGLLAVACLDPRRLNPHCEWVGDTSATSIDIRDRAQRQHLATDVRVAGENGVRYGDSARKRVGLEAAGRLSFECRDSLYAAIMRRHHVTRQDIHVAARTRVFWIDAVFVYLPMGALYYLVAGRVTRRIVRRLPPPDERWTMWLELVWIGLAGSAIAAALTHIHAWDVDWVRLRNGHMSFRAAYLPTSLYTRWVYAGLLAVYALAAWRQLRWALARPASEVAREEVNRWRR
jgi:hypothetical protein